MGSYLELPTYDFNRMTSQDKSILLKDFNRPIVIRGLYQCKAVQMKFDDVIELFGDSKLPVEIYDTNETRIYDANEGEITLKDLCEYWKTDKLPRLYCAEVDLFKQDMTALRKSILLSSFFNPNTQPREVHALMLYLGKNQGSDLHMHITSDFILNQLFGSKTVYIFSNYDNPNINKNSSFDMDKFNYSKEDFFKLDHDRMKIYKVTLQPGDSLLIPPWYWHATYGHGINMSITQIYLRTNISYLLTNPNIIIDYLIAYPEFVLIPVVFIVIIFGLLFKKRG